MATVQLPRMSFDDPDVELKRQRAELAAKAKTLLKYNGVTVDAKDVVSNLGSTLHRLGIAPLQREAVLAYKAKKSRRLVRLSTSWGCGLLGLASGLVAYGCSHHGEVIPVFLVVFVLAAVLTFIAVNLLWNPEWSSPVRYYAWQRVAISEYRYMVPEPVLLQAVQVVEADPECRVSIDSLVYHQFSDRPIRSDDPFLVVTKGNEEYYLDVWDESEFKNKL